RQWFLGCPLALQKPSYEEEWIRTPELIFSAEKIDEAVPRPNFCDGKNLSRGRIPPPPPSN
ncbi:MAG: hypothetical protein AAB696_01025, partial [Patescibacteria group bacterium]